ncbi:hypothetical protein E4T56_gene19658 [Termitomyces sp. T112]|nr:hypothetical protein E4T56_gene19658 [Termitomyces sp. T112]
MAPVTSSTSLPFDTSAPSIPEHVIHHKWEGPKYSQAKGNFHQWWEKLKDFLILNGIYAYIFDSTKPCPDIAIEPHAHMNWKQNDQLAITFIKSALVNDKHRNLVTGKGAVQCFNDLKSHAQREGPIKQIGLLQEALSTYCSTSEPLPTTAGCIVDTVKRAFYIGTIDAELFMCIALLNSLNDPSLEALQSSISTILSNSMKEKPCTPTDICLLMENAQNILNSKASHSTALLAKGGRRTSRTTDLPGHNHRPGAKGGGMAGKSLYNACDAQKASKLRNESTTFPNVNPAQTYVAITGPDGKAWYVNPSSLGQLPAPTKSAALANIPISLDLSTECWEHAGFMAFEEAQTSVNWKSYSGLIKDRKYARVVLKEMLPGMMWGHDIPDITHIASKEELKYLLNATKKFCNDPVTLELNDKPNTWAEAKKFGDSAKWEAAYRDELNSLCKMGVYELVPHSAVPLGAKVRTSQPVFKIKHDENGDAIHGRDYNKTTSPMAHMESCILPEEETQYMKQPDGFKEVGKEDWVWKLVRGLYGMKQAGQIWNGTVNDKMISWGFRRLASLHVNDFLSIASNKEENEQFKDQMQKPHQGCHSIILATITVALSVMTHSLDSRTLPNNPPPPQNLPQCLAELPQCSVPTLANSDTSLANSNIFPTVGNASPGSPEPLGPFPHHA